MQKDFEKVLLSKRKIAKRVKQLANQISKDYEGKDLLLICILKGSIMFCTDLFRNLKVKSQIDFMTVSSYGAGTTSSGEIKIINDLRNSIENKDVIVIEDIVDSGNTLCNLKKLLLSRNPASLKIATLLDKPDRRVAPISVDYCGFVIPDEFVVGYGLDYNQDYRQLPEVCILARHVYENK